MTDQLKLTIVQPDTRWEQKNENLAHLDYLLEKEDLADTLLLLPETFATGFTMAARACAEQMDGPVVQWMLKAAQDNNACVCGSVIIEDQGHFNRMIVAYPDGKILTYDKHHLFTLAKEHKTYAPGSKKLIFDWKGWKVCPMICYDLRFPAWCRNQEDYDLLFFSANWPEKRIGAWRILLQARAIENVCYVGGINRVGRDGNDINYPGYSAIIDPVGEIISQEKNAEAVMTAYLSREQLTLIRRQFKFLQDRDQFTIT